MKHVTSILLGVLVFCSLSYAAHTQKEFVVHFESDSSVLDAAAVAEIDKAIACTATGKYFEVTLDAHTDHDGSNQYNVELSWERAMSVVRYMVSKGVDAKRIQYGWYGEVKPVKPNVSEVGKQANRRVTVEVNIYDWNSAEEILDAVAEPQQEFVVNPAKPATIQSDGGVKIEIPENAFVKADGTPVKPGDVTIVLEDALTRESWLTAGLTTISPQGILESGGMFKIEALQNGEELKLKEGKQINVQVPFLNPAEGMSLFYADTDETGSMTWEQSDEPVKSKTDIQLPVLQMEKEKLNALILKYASAKAGYLPVDTAFLNLPKKPEFKLTAPRKPRKPEMKEVRLPVSGMKKMFMTKKQEEELKKEVYQKRMNVYEKNLAYYNKRMETYTSEKEKYDKDLAEFYNRQPEYEERIENAIATRDSLVTAHYKNIAYEQIHQCLSILSLRMSKSPITDPQFLTVLISNFSTGRYFRTENADDYYYGHYSYKTAVPAGIELIGKKLKELGYYKSEIRRVFYWSGHYYFSKMWNEDEQLTSLIEGARKKLLDDRFAAGVANSNDLNGYYSTSLSEIGWVNIDRFSKMNLSASLSIKNEPDSKVYIVFDDMNSVLPYSGANMKMPGNLPVTIFSVAIKDNMPHYAVEKITIKDKAPNTVELKYQKGLLQDIKNAIKDAA